MGATLLDGVVVEKHAMVAAGALVRQNTRIPSGEVWFMLFLFHPQHETRLAHYPFHSNRTRWENACFLFLNYHLGFPLHIWKSFQPNHYVSPPFWLGVLGGTQCCWVKKGHLHLFWDNSKKETNFSIMYFDFLWINSEAFIPLHHESGFWFFLKKKTFLLWFLPIFVLGMGR